MALFFGATPLIALVFLKCKKGFLGYLWALATETPVENYLRRKKFLLSHHNIIFPYYSSLSVI
jgi:hypothetical protein